MEHYNAFISYKHAPEDNVVAEAVHKGLERFHIPRKIRKKTGMKRISRIFRDKDELPITSDLSDSISTALADADYLIVICSTNTKESAWVPREIEYFLKNHSKRDIFTVLVNGEPYDVIPEILTYEDTAVKDEDGNERTVRIPIEPLSCDFRSSVRRAKKTELPRLASGIIGCAYDELMNRRRQYRLKQLMAVVTLVLAIAVGFCGYMYYSRDRIHKNYLESLKNQSKYLSNESENLLEKEQRITALQLALEALPKGEEDDRPVTAQAVKALTDATLAYESNNGKNIHAAWNYTMPGVVSDFVISSDGKNIAIRDDGNVIGVWNTADHERKLYLDNNDQRIVGLGFVNESALAFWSNKALTCYDVETKEKLWEYTPDEGMFKSGDKLMVHGDSLYLCTTDNEHLKIDAKTGKLQEKFPLSVPEGFEDFSIVESKLSPSGTGIAFRGMEGWNRYSYGVLDLSSKKAQIADVTDETVRDFEWMDDNTIMVASTFVDMGGSMSFESAQILSSDHSTIRCVNAVDLSEKWNTGYVCNGVMLESGFVKLGSDSVAYFSGNVITVYDVLTGTEKYTNNVNDSVIDVSDKDGDGSPIYITEDGGYASPALSIDTDAVYYNRYFTNELRKAVISNGAYVRQEYGREVIFYGVHVYDEEWKELCEDPLLPKSTLDYCMDEEYLVILSEDEEKGPVLDLFGLGEDAAHSRLVLEKEKAYRYNMLGIYKDKAYLGYDDSGTYDLVSVDLTNNKAAIEPLFNMSTSFQNALIMKDGKFIYNYRAEDLKNMIAIRDIETGETKEIALPEEAGYVSHAPIYYEEAGILYVIGEGEYVIDLESEKSAASQTPEGWTEVVCCSDNTSGGRYAVSDGRSILISGNSEKPSTVISCPGLVPLGMTFLQNHLIVLYSDGGVYRYLADDGTFLNRTETSIYYNYSGRIKFEFDDDNDLMFIRLDNLTDVIDMNSTVEIAHVLNCFGYQKSKDRFITAAKEAGSDAKAGYYRRYSVEDLITKAHSILNGAELSDEMRSRYGIK